jgi:protoporphyrinogen oxidase
MSPDGETGIVIECPCFQDDEIGLMSVDGLYRRTVDEIEDLGFPIRDRVLDWRHHFLPNAYPVYSLEYEEHLEKALEFLQRFKNLHTLGRNGTFFYSHLHDQFRFGENYISKLSQ